MRYAERRRRPSHSACVREDHCSTLTFGLPQVFVGVGFLLGAVENAFLYPFEARLWCVGRLPRTNALPSQVIKTHQQVRACLCALFVSACSRFLQSSTRTFSSTWAAVRDLTRTSPLGPRALYRGYLVSTVGTAPSTVLYLGLYNKLKELGQAGLQERGLVNPWLESVAVPLVAGGVADMASLSIYTPFDVVITHMQRVNGKYSGNFRSVVRAIAHNDGPRGFYRGLTATIFTTTPASTLWWPAYEGSKVVLGSIFAPSTDAEVAAVVAVAGGMAGAVASSLTNPMDVVRTRTVLGQGCYGETKPWAVLRMLVRNEGWSALTKGVVPRVAQAMPAAALASFTYEVRERSLRVVLRCRRRRSPAHAQLALRIATKT